MEQPVGQLLLVLEGRLSQITGPTLATVIDTRRQRTVPSRDVIAFLVLDTYMSEGEHSLTFA